MAMFSLMFVSLEASIPITRCHASSDAPVTMIAGVGAALDFKLEPIDGTGSLACLKSVTITSGTTRYIAAEGGIVIRGELNSLSTIVDDGFPNYYYGVGVANVSQRSVVVVSGFVDGGGQNVGIALSSNDDGQSWSPPTVVSNGTWLGGPIAVLRPSDESVTRVLMPSAVAAPVFSVPLESDGGFGAWTRTDAGQGWHAGPIVTDGVDAVTLTGEEICSSSDGGRHFNCSASADDVFDGGIAVHPSNRSNWLTGGGMISPDLSGWVHASSDAGHSWTARTLTAPYPIRWVGFACGHSGSALAIAAGGDYRAGVGGIWSSNDNGTTWTLEVDTGAEMASCAAGKGFLTCVGASSHAKSIVATAQCPAPTSDKGRTVPIPLAFDPTPPSVSVLATAAAAAMPSSRAMSWWYDPSTTSPRTGTVGAT